MATISKLKVGQILYDRHSYKMGNTSMRAWGTWQVVVNEIDPEFKFIIASWNGNPPTRMTPRQVEKLRVNKPTAEPKRGFS